jgi:hypothetical protein
MFFARESLQKAAQTFHESRRDPEQSPSFLRLGAPKVCNRFATGEAEIPPFLSLSCNAPLQAQRASDRAGTPDIGLEQF